MGQAATKERHGSDDPSGSSSSSSKHAKSYPASVDGGALVPQGVYQGVQDYDHDVVKTAIVQRRLMPFYKGEDDEETYRGRPFNTECPICFLVSIERHSTVLAAPTDSLTRSPDLTVLSFATQSDQVLCTARLLRMLCSDEEARPNAPQSPDDALPRMSLLHSRELWNRIHQAKPLTRYGISRPFSSLPLIQ